MSCPSSEDARVCPDDTNTPRLQSKHGASPPPRPSRSAPCSASLGLQASPASIANGHQTCKPQVTTPQPPVIAPLRHGRAHPARGGTVVADLAHGAALQQDRQHRVRVISFKPGRVR